MDRMRPTRERAQATAAPTRLHIEYDEPANTTGLPTGCCTYGIDAIEHMKKAAFFNYVLFEPFETLFVHAVNVADLTCGEHAHAFGGG